MTPSDQTTLSELSREHQFVIESRQIREAIDSRARELQPGYKAAGFRPGKVPLGVVRRRLGNELRNEAINNLVGREVERILAEEGAGEPIESPTVRIGLAGSNPNEPDESDDSGDLGIRLLYEVFPEVPVIDLKTMVLQKFQVVIGEGDLAEEVRKMSERNPQFQEADSSRNAVTGDQVEVDLVVTARGEVLEDTGESGLQLIVGGKNFDPELNGKLTGAKEGGSFQIERTVPVTERKGQAGRDRKCTFSYKVRGVRAPLPIEPNDTSAKAAGYESLAQFREHVMRQLEADARHVARRMLHIGFYRALAESMKFNVPPLAVMNLARRAKEDIRAGNPESGPETAATTETDAHETETDAEPTEKQIAAAKRRLRFLSWHRSFRKSLKLSVTRDDSARVLAGWDNPLPPSNRNLEFFDEMSRNYPRFVQETEQRVLSEKVMDAVLERATIEEKEIGYADAREALQNESSEW